MSKLIPLTILLSILAISGYMMFMCGGGTPYNNMPEYCNVQL